MAEIKMIRCEIEVFNAMPREKLKEMMARKIAKELINKIDVTELTPVEYTRNTTTYRADLKVMI